MPAMTALAGFVPCAESGMRQTVRCASPRLSWYARMTSRPGVLARSAGVGLERDAREPGDLGQPLF